jgi:hypothetical protein
VRKFTRWWWGVIGGAAAVLIAIGAFFAWGPVGFGPGPLAVAFVASSGTVPQSKPSMILIPVETRLSTQAVIDGVGITGGGGHPPPQILGVVGDQDQVCSGIWWPLTGHNGFARRCAKGGTVPLVGHLVPMRQATLVSTQGVREAVRTINIGIRVGAPGPSGCWGVGKVAVHYHVGSRHYTAVAVESLFGCTPLAQLAPDGTGAIAAPSASASPTQTAPSASASASATQTAP